MKKFYVLLGLAASVACGSDPGPLLSIDVDAEVPEPKGDAGLTQDAEVPDAARDDAALPDAGPVLAETTCTSQSFWMGGDSPSEQMNPGLPCRSCHAFSAPELAYYFAGTVFPSLHEQDLCNSPPPEGGRIEILNEAGEVVLTLRPNAAGNFSSKSREPGFPLPYRARVVLGEREATMQTLQYSGDCNLCHTEQGAQGAPGRIVWPLP